MYDESQLAAYRSDLRDALGEEGEPSYYLIDRMVGYVASGGPIDPEPMQHELAAELSPLQMRRLRRVALQHSLSAIEGGRNPAGVELATPILEILGVPAFQGRFVY